MTMRIRFDAPANHKLDLGNGLIIDGGKADNVDDKTAETLIDAPWVNVTIIPPGAAVWPKSQAKLDELADRLGFAWPEPEDGHKLTVQDKTAALEEAGHTPDSAYQPGDDAPQNTDTGSKPAGEGDTTEKENDE